MIKNLGSCFVDTSTGEVVDPTPYCLPYEYDVSPAVTEALTGLPLKETLTTTALIKKGRGRKPKAIDNPYCSIFQNLERKDVSSKKTLTTTALIKKGRGRKPKAIDNPYCSIFQNLERKDVSSKKTLTTTALIKSVAILPSVIDDVFTGALRLNEEGDNTMVPREQLLFVMSHLESLTVENIQSLFTAKRELKGDNVPRIRYCQYIMRKCESVINSLSYHIERGNITKATSFDFAQDAKDYDKYGCLPSCVISPAPFTKGDRELIQKLSSKGKLKEADAYVCSVSKAQKRMVLRVTVPSLSSIEMEMNREFPYDPYTEN